MVSHWPRAWLTGQTVGPGLASLCFYLPVLGPQARATASGMCMWTWVPQIWTHFLMLVQQALYLWNKIWKSCRLVGRIKKKTQLEPGLSANERVLAEKHQCLALPVIRLLEGKNVGRIESICLSQLELLLQILLAGPLTNNKTFIIVLEGGSLRSGTSTISCKGSTHNDLSEDPTSKSCYPGSKDTTQVLGVTHLAHITISRISLTPLVRFLSFVLSFIFMCMSFAFIYVYHMCVWCPQRLEERVGYPEIGVTVGCDVPCGHWELKLGPLQEQVLSVVEPSPAQASTFFFVWFILHVYEYFSPFVCHMCVATHGGQKRELDRSLGAGLKAIVKIRGVGTGSQTWVLSKAVCPLHQLLSVSGAPGFCVVVFFNF